MTSGKFSIHGDFLEHQGRKLFYILLEPVFTEAHSSILYLPPFADEMNKSRHIVANQARELVAAGYRVMLLDLTGCGDAGGDFFDASWQVWLQDARFAAEALADRGKQPVSLWGLRLGALLACELSQGRSDISKLVLWQPVLNGEQQVDQFLRLRTAASAVSDAITFDRKWLWNELRSGRSLMIAGYELSSTLALELARVRLNDLVPSCPVHWLEIGASPAGNHSAASENVREHWREQGVSVDTAFAQGDPFWRTIDAPDNPQLYANTLSLFTQ
ncbi:MAG: hydrolase 2, exosortase A system-associated [Halioglobus sp.]